MEEHKFHVLFPELCYSKVFRNQMKFFRFCVPNITDGQGKPERLRARKKKKAPHRENLLTV